MTEVKVHNCGNCPFCQHEYENFMLAYYRCAHPKSEVEGDDCGEHLETKMPPDKCPLLIEEITIKHNKTRTMI